MSDFDEIIGHTEHLLSAHSTREAIAQLEAENERLRKLLSDTNTYYAECIAEREDLRAEIRAYKRKALSPFFKNSDMSEDEAIAYQVSVGNMRIRLHKQADEIERLRERLAEANEANRRVSDENEKLREATASLVRSLSGNWYAFEPSLRLEMGNTNYHCVKEKMDEVEALLGLTDAKATLGESDE